MLIKISPKIVVAYIDEYYYFFNEIKLKKDLKPKEKIIRKKRDEYIKLVTKRNPKRQFCKSFYIRDYIIKIFIFLLLINLLIKASKERKLYHIVFNFSNITLKIKGAGYKNILGYSAPPNGYNSFDSKYFPNEIYINGIKQDKVYNRYTLNETINIIELKWNHTINTTKSLFRNCYDTTEIDLSNFDTLEITDMTFMFIDCWSLTSINFSNFNTSKVTSMNCMFSDCRSLTSFDLSLFDTSIVTCMYMMFNNCTSLISLDLSHFITSVLVITESMFKNCKNLQYVNMWIWDEFNLTEYNNMFKNTPENIIICINDTNNNSKI